MVVGELVVWYVWVELEIYMLGLNVVVVGVVWFVCGNWGFGVYSNYFFCCGGGCFNGDVLEFWVIIVNMG